MNITKFEIQSSRIVEAFYRLFCLPNDEISDQESGKLIISRLICFMKMLRDSPEIIVRLVSNLLEQSLHYNEFILSSASLTNDFVFLANDLRKFGRRTKL